MSQQTIDTSTETDTLAAGFTKVNDNFTEVYSLIVKTGFVVDYIGSTAPDGWILANGSTIGSSSSLADLASDDTEDLFSLFWTTYSDVVCPVSGGRGASATADFAANKTLAILDFRGKVTVHKDSGTFASLGAEIGSETHALSSSELPIVADHSHPVGDPVSVASGGDFNVFSTSTSSPSTCQNGGGFGSGDSHNNIQPSIVVNKIIKL